jgi:hypothetical protein
MEAFQTRQAGHDGFEVTEPTVDVVRGHCVVLESLVRARLALGSVFILAYEHVMLDEGLISEVATPGTNGHLVNGCLAFYAAEFARSRHVTRFEAKKLAAAPLATSRVLLHVTLAYL